MNMDSGCGCYWYVGEAFATSVVEAVGTPVVSATLALTLECETVCGSKLRPRFANDYARHHRLMW